MRTIWAEDVGAVAISFVGLIPIGWLMAQTFLLPNSIGWWATLLFVVPLFTTRSIRAVRRDPGAVRADDRGAVEGGRRARPVHAQPLEPGEPHRRGDVPRDAAAGERDRAHQVGRAAARHRQDRHPRQRAAEGGAAGQERADPHEPAPDHRRGDRGAGEPAGLRGAADPGPSRVDQRLRLPGRPRGAGHPARRARPDDRRRLRGDDLLAPLPQDPADPRAGRRPARALQRHPVRPRDRAHPGRPGSVHPRPPARPRRRATHDAPPAPHETCPRRRSSPELPWPRTMFLSTILLALIVGALAGEASRGWRT